MKLHHVAASALLFLPAAFACSDDDGAGPDSLRVATVVVEPDSSGIIVGETLQLSAAALSQSGDTVDADIQWSTSASAVATVDGGGSVLGVGLGRAELTASAEGISGTAVVTVAAPPSLRISPESATIGLGVSLTLIPSISGADDPRLRWHSADTAIAQVDANGVVTGVGVGTTQIDATLLAHPDVQASVVVTVDSLGPISISPQDPTIVVGGHVQMHASGFGGPVTWGSSDTQVASIDSTGLVTGLSFGTTVLTARSADNPGVVASTTLTVAVPTGPGLSVAAIHGPNGESVDPRDLQGDIVVVVNAEAHPSEGVAELTLLVDTTVVARRSYTGGPLQWSATFDTRAFANGQHEIWAQMLDANGNEVESSTRVPVTFNN